MSASSSTLEAVLAHLHSDSQPGVVASVRRHGRTLLREGRGLATLDGGSLNTPATRMAIGSTTKHFAALLVLLLRDEGRLLIDEPISRWLPELPASQGQRTLRQLMTHTGGQRDFLDLSLLANGLARLPPDAPLSYQCRQRGQNFAPGDQFIYNNGGYHQLSLVIERVLDMPLAQALHERLFEPLAMFDTALRPDDRQATPGVAQTHVAQPGGGFSRGFMPAAMLGEGGIVSTIDDLQRWVAHLVRPTLWPEALWREMTAPTPLNNGHANPYGFGLISGTWRGVRVIHHAGGVVGGTCQMLIAPDLGLHIVVMSNRSDVAATDLADRLLAAAVGDGLDAPPTPVDPAGAEDWAGHHLDRDSGRHLEITNLQDTLVLKTFGVPLPLAATAEEDTLRASHHSAVNLVVKAVRDADQRIVAIELSEQGRRHRCERLPTIDKPSDGLHAFAGNWHSDDLDATATIEGDALRFTGRYGSNRFTLAPISVDCCLLSALDLPVPLGGTLRLTTPADGRRRLLLDTARTRHLLLTEAVHG